MGDYSKPGLYRRDVSQGTDATPTNGVPAILGYGLPPGDASFFAAAYSTFADFQSDARCPDLDRYLRGAVQGFFDCGGSRCVVGVLNTKDLERAWSQALAWLREIEEIDLICAPSLMSSARIEEVVALQEELLNICQRRGDCFAILDTRSAAMVDGLLLRVADEDRQRSGALYFPWISTDGQNFLPPSGHVAGVYSRSDRKSGPHRAPANETLDGIVDLKAPEGAPEGTPEGLPERPVLNLVRLVPGHGARIRGARTLVSNPASPWCFIGVRRLFTSVVRQLVRTTSWAAFEPSELKLWLRLTRQLSSYFLELYQRGALKGSSAAEAFYIKCDDETNPPAVREAGQVVVEIGLAPAFPAEFIEVRLIQAATGASVSAAG